MSLIKIQGASEKRRGIYYQVDSSDKPIGIGGMGQVFKGICVDERTGSTRPVAIKFMYADLPPHAIERARREAAIQLRNDNLVEMLGFIEVEERQVTGEIAKHYHVVSELLTGVSLSDVLEGKTKDRDGHDVPFAVKMLNDYRNDSEHFARTIVLQVLSGLMALHDAGYIHRDIDPTNIMLTQEGHVKLIDFGIAKQMNNLTTGDKALTVAGAFMGKPEYAAPELVLGDIKHQSQATDIYAVGILLYQCIVGHTPFEGARHNILEQQLKGKLPLGVIKNRGLRKIIATACNKKQELRYQTSAQMRVALETFKPNPFPIDTVKYAIIGVAAAAVILGAVLFLTNRNSSSDETESQAVEAAVSEEKAAVLADVERLILQADQALALGKDKSKSNYEFSLMEAYDLYDQARTSGKNVLDAKQDNSLAKSQQEAVQLLNDAAKELGTQAQDLQRLGEVDYSLQYQSRADAIVAYLQEKHLMN